MEVVFVIIDTRIAMTKPGALDAPKDSPIRAQESLTGSVLSRRIEAQVALHPGAVALTLDGANLTYGELNARANQIAARLRELGVGPESLVGIHLDRTFDLVAGIFGILKAGGAYLPLDLACPEDRLSFMLEDSGAKAVLTHSSLASRFAPFKGPVICLDRETERLAAYSKDEKVKDVQAMAGFFDPKTGFLPLVPGADTGFEGHDLGYLLWDLVEIGDWRKDEVYAALVNGPTADCWGSFDEAYDQKGHRNGHDLRSLETGINLSALAKYWGLGRQQTGSQTR